MISWSIISAVWLRYVRLWRRDQTHLLFLFYWPLLDILVMGWLGSWVGQNGVGALHNYQLVTLGAIVLWQVVGRGCNSLIGAMVEELYSANLVNLFSLPLDLINWIGGVILYYLFTLSLLTSFSMLVIKLCYDVEIGFLLALLAKFALPLILSAIWIGFTSLQAILIFGKRGIELAYVGAWFLMPFSCLYYPIEALPVWAQKLASILPMAHVFEGMRQNLLHGTSVKSYLIISTLLALLYAALAIGLFAYSFERCKRQGLVRLLD